MKNCFLICILSFSLSSYSTNAQTLSSNSGQININADFPFGKVQAQNDGASAELDQTNGILNITAFNKGFHFKPALKADQKKELSNIQQHSSTSIKAQITNLKTVDFTKDGNYRAKVIGRFVYNGVASTFYVKGEIIIEHGIPTLSMQLDVFLTDHEVMDADKSNRMEVDILIRFE